MKEMSPVAGAVASVLTLIVILFGVIVWQATEGAAWALVGIGMLVSFLMLLLGAGIAILAQHVNAKQDERLMRVNAAENAQIMQQQFRAQKELTMAMLNTVKMHQIIDPKIEISGPPGLPELPDGLFDDL